MALRVLLADESTTIKKVMQLALQDFGVEVKSVAVGLDVLPVAKAFKPDVIFVDVLLQKLSGYDVAKSLKEAPEFTKTPVVLMWSGFMELDEAKVHAARIDGRLEKPFDTETLRGLIKDLVPKTTTNTISDYLTFPAMPEFTVAQKSQPSSAAGNGQINVQTTAPAAASSVAMTPPPEEEINIFDIPEVAEDEEFAAVSLTTQQNGLSAQDSWSHQDLAQITTGPTEKTNSGIADSHADFEKFIIPTDDLNLAQVQSSGDFEEVTFVARSKAIEVDPSAATVVAPRASMPKQSPALNPASGAAVGPVTQEVLAEKIIREEAHAVIEKIAWQILPAICERVVREELNRLLKDTEKNLS